MRKILWATVGVGLAATLATAGGQAQAVDAKVCDVVNHPRQWDGKVVRLTGVVQTDFDSFLMRGDACSGALWLNYPTGTKAKSGPATVLTLQLASNASGTPGTARPAVTLERGKDFETFDNLLSQKPKTSGMCLGCVKNDVTATLVGRIDGTENPGIARDKSGAITGLDGFGNMNLYMARMVIQSVSNVTAKEIDYSKAAKVDGDSPGGNAKDYVALTRKTEESFAKGSPPVGTIEAALAAFGAAGQDNGVTVGFGNTANVPEGDGTKAAKASQDGLLLTVLIDTDKLKGDAESRAIAHQGTEINDLRAKETKGAFAIEADAWQTVLLVTIGARQKSLTLPGGIVYWNDKWTQEERNANSTAGLTEYLQERDQTPR
jgi:hypothetical protein